MSSTYWKNVCFCTVLSVNLLLVCIDPASRREPGSGSIRGSVGESFRPRGATVPLGRRKVVLEHFDPI